MATRTTATTNEHHDLVVVGGGIIGLACAWQAAAAGMDVLLLERGTEPAGPNGGAATWASAGMLAPIADLPEPGAFFPICRRSRDLWPAWVAALDDVAEVELDYHAEGAILLGDDALPGQRSPFLEGMRDAARAMGEPAVELDASALAAALPDLDGDFAGAIRLPGEHRVDNRAVSLALGAAARAAGVTLRGGAEVREVSPQPGGGFRVAGAGVEVRADRVLVAAGSWTSQIVGLPPLPIAPIRGQMFAVAGVEWPYFGSVRGAEFYAVRRRDGRLLVGATLENAGFAAQPTAAGLAALHGWLARFFPALTAKPLVEIWAGLRPATPDHLPAIGESAPGLFVAGGHFRNGILLAPWTARVVTALLQGGEGELDTLDRQALAEFAPARFQAGAPSRAQRKRS